MAKKSDIFPFMLTFIKYTDVFGGSVSLDTLVRKLKQFKLSPALVLLSKLGLVLNNEQFWRRHVQEYLKGLFFSSEVNRKIAEVQEKMKSPVVFFDLQVLNLMKLVILHCSEKGSCNLDLDEEIHDFGLCCLMMNDVIPTALTGRDDFNRLTRDEKRDLLIQEFVRNLIFQSDEDFRHALVRYNELLFEIPPLLKNSPDYTDIPSRFRHITSLDLKQYFALGFALLANWRCINIINIQKEPSLPIAVNEDTYFKDVILDKGITKKIFEAMRIPLDKFRKLLRKEVDALQKGELFQYSFLTCEKYPLIKLNNGAVLCLNMRLLMKKITQNIYWIVMDGLRSDAERLKFTRFFGQVFHHYVKETLKRMFGSRFIHSIHYGKAEEEASDGIIQYPQSLIFVEAKSARLLLKTIRSGDIPTYKENLRDVLVKGSKQLDRVITDFREGKFSLPGFKMDASIRFYPLILTLQSVPQNPLIWKLYSDILRDEGLFKTRDVAMLQFMDIEELEKLEPIIEEKDFLGILGEKVRSPQFWDISFKNYLILKYGWRIKENEYIKAKFLELGDEIGMITFGKKLKTNS